MLKQQIYIPQTASKLWLDELVAGIFFFLCASLSVTVLVQVGTLFFYQNFSPEVIYEACGLGFKRPGTVPAALQNFLLVKQSTFDCSLLDPTASLQPPGLFARLQLYLSYSIAPFWRPPILAYIDLWPVTAVLGGAYASGAYVLFRQFLPRLLSILGGLLITLSPLALSLTPSLRDYSKAPFFIWGTVFLICAIRATTLSRACLSAFAAGLVAGIGIGFRGDLLVLVAAGLIALLVVTRWCDLRLRLPAMVVFAATAIACAWPILGTSAGSSYGSVVMQGMSDPYLRFLGLDRSLYSLGARYSDELVLSSIAAAERPKVPGWDSDEAKPLYGISKSITLSGQNAVAWMPLFVGDIATQGLKSLAWLTAMPALVANNRPNDPGFGGVLQTGAILPGGLVYAVFGHAWLVPLGLVGIIAFSWREFALRPHPFPATAVLLGLIAASTVVQFAVRHIFHLEFLWILSLLSLGMAVRDRDKLRLIATPFVLGLGVLVTLVASIYASLLFYQQGALKEALSNLLAMPRETVEASKTIIQEGDISTLSLTLPVPAQHTEIVRAPDDSMNNEIPLMGLQWDVRAEADRLLISLTNCQAGSYTVSLGYETTPTVWQPMNETIPIYIDEQAGTRELLVTAFYRPTQHLSTLAVTPYPDACVVRLERVEGESPLPYLLTAVFPPDWQDKLLFRGFGGFGAVTW